MIIGTGGVDMWRSVLLTMSASATVKQLMTGHAFGRWAASRFVAGESIDDAIAAAEEVNRRGAAAELDYLGEHVEDERQAAVAVGHYLSMVDRIVRARVDSHVSVKASQMGQELSDRLCEENMLKVISRAAELGIFVWLDMEDSRFTERTIQLYKNLRAQHDNVGIALQSYLYRTNSDVEEIIAVNGTVRLCKGAYDEPADVAFSRKEDVDRNFALLTEVLLTSGHQHAIATHDEKMIHHTIEFARSNGIGAQDFEFQMLYGVRRDLQARLVRDGYGLRIYIPYGEQWYPYLMRRLAERPANLLFLTRNVISEALSKEHNGARRRA